jgi:hypothetical protein
VPLRAVVGCVALALLAAACGDGGDGAAVKIDWDLSTSHTMADTGWPKEHLKLDAVDLNPVDSVRIRFSGDRELVEPDGIRRVGLSRDRQQLTELSIHSEPLTVDGAYRLALRWCREWKLPTKPIDDWHASGGKNFNTEAYNPRQKVGPDEPEPSVKLGSSFEDEPRTTLVRLIFFWDPDLTASASG